MTLVTADSVPEVNLGNIAIHSSRYILYYKDEPELKKAVRQMARHRRELRERGAFSSKERAAGYMMAHFPLTHCIVMGKLNPNWIEDDWPKIEKFALGKIAVYPVQLKPNMIYDRPLAGGGSVRFMTANELWEARGADPRDEPERLGSEENWHRASEARVTAMKSMRVKRALERKRAARREG